ncbi:hypothetical protein PMAYCL1PPCAC_26959, partial [Pristionchus mayeri]
SDSFSGSQSHLESRDSLRQLGTLRARLLLLVLKLLLCSLCRSLGLEHLVDELIETALRSRSSSLEGSLSSICSTAELLLDESDPLFDRLLDLITEGGLGLGCI